MKLVLALLIGSVAAAPEDFATCVDTDVTAAKTKLATSTGEWEAAGAAFKAGKLTIKDADAASLLEKQKTC